jgi:two-component sensor histidine kinase/predicted house-cleaning NTP pyrophosphatase (Maf/HAM1 superfamily)
MNRILTLLFLITFYFSINAQQSKIDSLKQILTTKVHDTLRLTIYHDLINYYARNNLDVAERYCDSLKYISDSKNISKFQIDYYVLKGTLQFYRQNFEEATKTFKKGLTHKKIDSFFHLKSSLINNTSIGFKIQKKLDSFVKYIKYAEKLNLSRNNVTGLLVNYNALSDYYINISDFNNASIYLNKLMELAIKTDNKESIARANIQLGLISRKELDFEAAISQFQKAINHYEDFDSDNIVMIRGMKHEIATTHILNKNYTKAIEILEKIKIDFGEFSKQNMYNFQLDLSLLDCYVKVNDFEKAQPIYNTLSKVNPNRGKTTNMVYLLTLSEYEIKFKTASQITLKKLLNVKNEAIEVNNIEICYLAEKSISQYYALKNENKKAFFHLTKSFIYKDSLSNRESKIINLAHKRKFNEELKEKENLQLKADNIEQELLTQKANTRNWILGFGLLILLISVFFIYKRYKSEAKAKEIISKQKAQIEKLQKEFHHRIKNDFRSINSFIRLAQKKFPNTEFQERLNELKNRVTSMFKVHELLLEQDDVTQVKARPYFVELSENVKQKYQSKNITIDYKIDNKEVIIADKSVPFGIIVNEFVTNSYKHAFDGSGNILVNFYSDNSNHYLTLKDNGKGLPSDFDTENLRSFGMEIMPLLAEQYDGKFTLESNKGVAITVTLPKLIA